MKYTAWLWYQLEEVGPGHAFAKVCWDDVNNGCASTKFSVNDWLLHFEQKHLDNRDILIHRLIQSFDEFKKATEEK
jgi:hypothetical protein